MSDPKTIAVTLPETACTMALRPTFGGTRGTAGFQRYLPLKAKINSAPVDQGVGEAKAVRHVVLSVNEAKELLRAFQESGDAYSVRGRQELVGPCGEAAANVRHALRLAGIND